MFVTKSKMAVPSDLRDIDKLDVHSKSKYPFNKMARWIHFCCFKMEQTCQNYEITLLCKGNILRSYNEKNSYSSWKFDMQR